jgi:hypothetical protein
MVIIIRKKAKKINIFLNNFFKPWGHGLPCLFPTFRFTQIETGDIMTGTPGAQEDL